MSSSKKKSKKPNNGGGKDSKKKLESEIHAMISEYLAYSSYSLTVDCLTKEKKKKESAKNKRNAALGKGKRGSSNSKEADYRRFFDEGDGPKFFALLNKQFPINTRKKHATLWFRLHIYFAIYPFLSPSAGKPGAQDFQVRKHMDYFKRFLERHGSSANNSMLPYYGLPFIADPRHHPTFEHLFEDAFLTSLKADLFQALLEKGQPKLMRMTQELTDLHKAKEALQGGMSHRNQMASEAMQVLFGTAMDLFETLALYHTQVPSSPPSASLPLQHVYQSPRIEDITTYMERASSYDICL